MKNNEIYINIHLLIYLFGINVVGAISFSRQSGHSWSSDSKSAPLIPKKETIGM